MFAADLKATFQLQILGVKKNPQSPMYTQLGVLTKGTVIEVNVSELGMVTAGGKVVFGKYAQVTNNPENDGCINAVLRMFYSHCTLYTLTDDLDSCMIRFHKSIYTLCASLATRIILHHVREGIVQNAFQQSSRFLMITRKLDMRSQNVDLDVKQWWLKSTPGF